MTTTTKTKMTTKTKIKDSLKNIFINELKDKKEEERLERVKTNGNLKEVTIFTHKQQPQCKQFTDMLTQEGIKFNEIDASEGEGLDEWNKVVSITNLGMFPTVLVNQNFLVQRRDFQNAQQLVGAIQYFGSPKFENPTFEGKMFEQMKTNQFNLFQIIQRLEGRLNPLITFIDNLQKQITEEENIETNTEVKKDKDCGCGKKKK
jgi:glutaredoxin